MIPPYRFPDALQLPEEVLRETACLVHHSFHVRGGPVRFDEELANASHGPVSFPDRFVSVRQKQVQPPGSFPKGVCGEKQGKGGYNGAEGDQRQKEHQKWTVSHRSFFR